MFRGPMGTDGTFPDSALTGGLRGGVQNRLPHVGAAATVTAAPDFWAGGIGPEEK
jgi:hypothetical protein